MNCTALRAVDRHSAKYRLRSAQAFVYGLKGKRLIQVEAIDIEKYSSELVPTFKASPTHDQGGDETSGNINCGATGHTGLISVYFVR